MEGQQSEGREKAGAVEAVEYTIEDMDTSPIDLQGGDDLNISDDLLSDASKSASVTVMQECPNFRENVIAFAEKYSISQASKRFKIAPSTIKKWLKAEDIQMRPKFNSPGQGRKISYSKETDDAIAEHVRELLAKEEKISVQYLCNYGKTLIQEENPQFNASTGWAQRFLLRHGIDLSSHKPKRASSLTKADTCGTSSEFLTRGRPLSYSVETDQAIADFVREKQAEGQIITNSELRKHARELISKENPNFTGSASWAQNFLLRHRLALNKDGKDSLPSTSSQQPPPPTLHLGTSHSPAILSSPMTESPLEPAAEMTPTSAPPPPVYATIADSSVTGLEPTDTGVDDPMVKTALAILTGENIDSTILNPAQAAAIQSTLSELSSETVSLVELLNNAQHLQEHTAEGVTTITHGLDPPSTGIYLGLPTSEAFAGGLTGPAATQVNPNTQAPTTLFPRMVGMRVEQEMGQASRPLSYTKETDQLLANWVQEQQATGKKVTFASLRAYAKKLVSSENPNFNASVGWVTPFLLRHNLDLSINKKKKQPRKGTTPRKIETPDGSEEKVLDVVDMTGPEINAQFAAEVLAQAIINTHGMNHPGTHPTTVVPEDQEVLQVAGPENPVQLSDLQQAAEDPTSQAIQPEQMIPTPSSNTEPETATSQEKKFAPRKRPKTQRVRHTLSEKLEVVKLMREYNVAAHYVCRMLGIANSTLAGWIKLVQQKGAELEALSANKKRANVSGQGRPLSYSKEKDETIARWVRSQQEIGMQVTPADLAKYATSVIGEENTNFTASSGWQQKFLQRHNLQLWQKSGQHNMDKTQAPTTPVVEDQQNIPAPVQTEEVVTHEFSTNILEKPYSDETDDQLAQWVKETVRKNGSLSVQGLCRHAEEVVIDQNPMFVATLGWAFKFLHRHSLLLDPKPSISVIESPVGSITRKRSAEDASEQDYLGTPKKVRPRSLQTPDATLSPSTGNLCEALLALSNQAQEGGENSQTVQAAVHAVQSAVQALQQQQQQSSPTTEDQPSPGTTYFGKPAREFSSEEKEEVVRYANATTLQKAALKFGVAAPTVWRWRVELKLHQPKYTPMQKRYIIKFAETNSLKEASQRYGITSKTIQNWRKMFQAEGELPTGSMMEDPSNVASQEDIPGEVMKLAAAEGTGTSEVVTYDNQNFQFIVDGGEVVETSGSRGEQAGLQVDPVPLEVTTEMDIENVGMEYDVISSEGHAAKPRCTPQEKLQILQYALNHSVKEASAKFGISPGTVYYWKKSQSGNPNNENPSQSMTSTSAASLKLATSGDVSTTTDPATSDQFAGNSGMIQALNTSTVAGSSDGVMELAEQFIASGGDAELVQSLANLSPEALQNLSADVNLLQAVTSLLSNAEAEGNRGRKSRRLDSNSGGISSPTDVLVPPFQAPASKRDSDQDPTSSSAEEEQTAKEATALDPQILSSEVVPISESSEVTVSTSDGHMAIQPSTFNSSIHLPEGVPQVSTTCEDLAEEDISHDQDQPHVCESVEVSMDTMVQEEPAQDVAISQTVELTVDPHPDGGTDSLPNSQEATPQSTH